MLPNKHRGIGTLSKDYYAAHLAKVNETRTVIASENITNDQGMLIVRKGTPISPEIAQKIIRFKLLNPLECSVKLESSIGAKDIFRHLCQLSEKYQARGALPLTDLEPALNAFCHDLSKYPLILQKLTVMAERLPALYQDALISVIVGIRIARKLKMDERSTKAVFLAALMHDAGLLNIDPNLVKKKGVLTDTEWKTLQGHVAISKLFLSLVPGVDKLAVKAVLEHHERIDGTGYPVGKVRGQLSREGQVIAIADTASAIFRERLQPYGYGVKDCVPVLQIIAHAFRSDVHEAIMSSLVDNPSSPRRALGDQEVVQQAGFLLAAQKIYIHWFELMSAFIKQCAGSSSPEDNQQMATMVASMNKTIQSSGIFSAELTSWLKSKPRKSRELQELEYTGLMYDELGYQFKQLYRMLRRSVQQTDDAWAHQRLEELYTLLETFPSPDARFQSLQKTKAP